MTALLTAFGLSGAAGLNAYIPLMTLAVLGRVGIVHLAAPFDQLTHTWAIVLIGILLAIEVAVDKIPGIDHVNDVVQTLVRPAAGAIVFGASTGALDAVPSWVAIAAGLVTAFSVHATKAAARPAVNVTTLGVGAPVVSVVEDVLATATSLTAVLLPYVALLGLMVIAVLLLWLLRRRRAYAAQPHADPPTT